MKTPEERARELTAEYYAPDPTGNYPPAGDAAIEEMETWLTGIIGEAVEAAAPRWIPVGERLPSPLVRVMVFIPNSGIRLDSHDPDDTDSDGGWRWSNVSHWMPLPPDPAS